MATKKTLTAVDLIGIMKRHASEMEKNNVELSYTIGPKISDIWGWMRYDIELEQLNLESAKDIKHGLKTLRKITQGSESDVYRIGWAYDLGNSEDGCRLRLHADVYFLDDPLMEVYQDIYGGFANMADPIVEELERNYKPLKSRW